MKIVLIQRVITVYRISLFETLLDRARSEGNDLELWSSIANKSFSSQGTSANIVWARVFNVLSLPSWLGGLERQNLPRRDVLAADVIIVPKT